MPTRIDTSWEWTLRHLLLPIGDRVFRQRMLDRLRYLEQAQWWPRERIEEVRDRTLRETLATVYETVPFYRELWNDAGVSPTDVRTAGELHRLPAVTKDQLRAAYPDQVTRPTAFPARVNRTSGSTGKNFAVRTDTETIGWYRAALLLMLGWAGWRLGERHVQTGMNPERSLDRIVKDGLLRCTYVSAYDLTDDRLDHTLETIERSRIRYLFGYPGSVYLLARRALQVGWNVDLRSVVTWGDMLYARYRRTVERAFSCAVHDTYGCAEGIQVAGECEAHTGYHVLELDTVAELVSEDGAAVAPGESGALLLTRLHAGPMPFIRYRIGDLGRSADDDGCVCGRDFRRLAAVEGRNTDVVITPEGNRLIVHFFTGTLENFDEVDAFQVVQRSVDAITLKVVAGAGFTRDTEERLVDALRGRGADLRIDVEVVDAIPLETTGKRRFVVSEVDEGA